LRKSILIVISFIFSLYSYAQQPTMFSFTPTNSSGTLYGQAQIDGIPATSNDWIAVFDASGVCCGASPLIMNSGVAYINLVIYGDDVTTPTIDEGMSGSEDFTLKLYQYSSGLYLDYPSNNNNTFFSGWSNTNGAPIPAYSNVNDIYNFLYTSLITLNLNIALCENDAAVILIGGLPTGGVYSGAGVSNGVFDPATAGPGNHVITYSVNNDSAFAIATVYGLVDVTLLTSGPFCDNENNISLNSITPGGIYSGSGVVGGSFNPDMVGAGSFWITYTITDSNNCTQNEPTLLVVNAAPLVPNIIQNGNVLECTALNLDYQWLDASQNPISGANGQTFTPTTNGDYFVMVSNVNCTENSDVFQFITSSIKDLKVFNIFQSENLINIVSEHPIKQVIIRDISTKIVSRNNIYNSHIIDTSKLPNGMYIIQLEFDHGRIFKKIIL